MPYLLSVGVEMSRFAAVVALLVLVGCADDGERFAEDTFVAPEAQEAASKQPAPVEDVPTEKPVLRFLEFGPVTYDVSSLTAIQKLVVQQVMDHVNLSAGVLALAIHDGADVRPYGVINVHGNGCELANGDAGFASWNFGKMRSTVCVDWKDDRLMTITIITHELLHTLGLGHDSEPRSVMAQSAVANQLIMPHHIAHIRKLAGLE